MLTKQTKQAVHSHKLMEGRLDHHSPGMNYAQKIEDRQDPTLPANLPVEKLDCW